MPGFVTDASATLPWCFADETTPWTEALLDRLEGGEEVLVPANWPTEVMNGHVVAVRRNRIDVERAARFAADLSSLAIRIEAPHAPATWMAVIEVAIKHHLTVYDAAYLALQIVQKRASQPGPTGNFFFPAPEDRTEGRRAKSPRPKKQVCATLISR
jgi:predicted nucleic acid-binding protein